MIRRSWAAAPAVSLEEDPMADEINIRNISVKCGHCNTYQTLTAFSRRDEWNVYSYECENETCDPAVTRTLIEVPREMDTFARRDAEWRGGGKHGEEGDGSPLD
jgi:hypothetical protein